MVDFRAGADDSAAGLIEPQPTDPARGRTTAASSAATEREFYAALLGRVEQLEAELVRTREAAAAALRSKSVFLANMSHEIRTPMTAIVGFSELLAGSQLSDEERQGHARLIRENAHLLLQLIDDVLDLSQIEAGGVVLDTRDCTLADAVNDVAGLARVAASEKDLQLRVEFQEPLPTFVHTDPVRLKQVLLKLLSNAVAAGDRGEICLKVSASGINGDSPQLHFAVQDRGAPIDADELADLFRPFGAADATPARRRGGSPVNLAIAKRLAERLGGDVLVSSDPDQGTVFTLVLGLRPADKACPTAGLPQPADGPPHAGLLRGRVLVAEDGAANQHLLKLVLGKAGLEVDLVEDGRQALQRVAQSAAEGRPYDVIVMDIQMPGINGFDAVARLRRFGWEGPIIAVTACAMVDDRRRCLEAGCDDYFPKPVNRPALMARITHYLEAPPGSSPAAIDLEQAGTGHLGLLDDPRFDLEGRMGAFHAFVDGLPERIEAIQRAATAADHAALAAAAHRLAVAARLFGLTELAGTAAGVARSFSGDGTAGSAADGLAELIAQCRRIVAGRG